VNEEIFQDIQNDKSLDDANDKPESFVKPVDDREFGKDIDAGKEDMKQLICKYNDDDHEDRRENRPKMLCHEVVPYCGKEIENEQGKKDREQRRNLCRRSFFEPVCHESHEDRNRNDHENNFVK
jgi:hypothetical protein